MDEHSECAQGPMPPEWALVPIRQGLSNLEDEARFLHLSRRGLATLGVMPAALHALAQSVSVDDTGCDFRRTVNQARAEAEWVREEVEGGFPLLHRHGTVALWGTLEALLEDLAVAWLSNQPGAWSTPPLRKLKVPLAEFHLASEAERPRLAVRELGRSVGADARAYVGQLGAVLQAFDLAPSVKPNLKRALRELAQVRNVIVHRGAVADQKLLDECPWVDWKRGETVRVSHPLYGWYFSAARRYAERMVDQLIVRFGGVACQCPGMDEIPKRPPETEASAPIPKTEA